MDTSILPRSNEPDQSGLPVRIDYCSKCGKFKPVTEFGEDKKAPNGRRYHCLLCESTPTAARCSKCGKSKPVAEFAPNKKAPNGLRSYCRSCEHDQYLERKARQRVNMRSRNLRVKFGMDEAAYQKLFNAQGGVCAICHKPETKVLNGALLQLAIDHDHETGQIRGLLCNACNVALGLFRDNVDNLQNAVEYLKSHK